MAYHYIALEYSLADIERFTALSIRRGSDFASLAKSSDLAVDNVRIAACAALLFVPIGEPQAPEAVLAAFSRFLAGPGAWLSETPASIYETLLERGFLLELEGGLCRNRLEPAPGVTAERLIDEVEAAESILARRRAERRAELQTKNRTVNSGLPPVDPAEDERFMRIALAAAREAAREGEVPVGAVLVSETGQVMAAARNRTIADADPTAHAEILALREGAKQCENHRLTGTTLYVTLEPCPMCAGAIAEARCRRIVFGAPDPRRGALEGALRLFDLPGVNHRPAIASGVLADEAKALLAAFFAERRQKSGVESAEPQDA